MHSSSRMTNPTPKNGIDYGSTKLCRDEPNLPRVIVTNSSNRRPSEAPIEAAVDEIDLPADHPSSDHISVPILCLFQSCLGSFLQAKGVHRALCFGALDGLLTGSGITAACAGLGLFHPFYTSFAQRLMVLTLSTASCISDGLCMGIDHIWNSHLSREQSKKEIEKEQWKFDYYRSVSKARMVDALLRRGMLKIDAMSVVDTLEGYPDVFVAALSGDANGYGPLGIGGGNDICHGSTSFADFSATPVDNSSRYIIYDDMEEGEGKCLPSNFYTNFWSEGFILMLSFSLCSLLPSYIYGFVPLLIYPEQPDLQHSQSTVPSGDILPYSNTGVSCASLTMTALSFIALLLGIWKSTFISANWIIFGLEAVFLLLISMISAYGIGAFAVHVLGVGQGGFSLSVKK